MSGEKTSASFFESMYAGNADPWSFECSPYERERYNKTIDALGKRFYERAFEPGCSIGMLTQALARFCARVESIDIAPTAVARAQQRCTTLPNVTINVGALPQAIPDGHFDLMVFSEIGYYFEEATLAHMVAQLVERLEPGGILLAVHWLGVSADHVLSGDRVHQIIGANAGLALQEASRFPAFRLDRMVRL